VQCDSFATVEMCRSLKINTTEGELKKKGGGRGKEAVNAIFNESLWEWFSLYFISIFTE
jgi:hypothetical protein